MFGLKKSPLNKFMKQSSVDPGFPSSNHNPFDSDVTPESQNNTLDSTRRASSEPALANRKFTTNPFDVDEGREVVPSSSSSHSVTSSRRSQYSNGFRESGGLENQTVQELEHYAVYKAEETTKEVNNCLRIAEDIREGATKTLVTLHQQGEQITRTHANAADIEHDLSRGEKLLGSLGGMFSKTWKPKKIRSIQGPSFSRDDPVRSKGSHLEQKQRLGLLPTQNEHSRRQPPAPESTNALERVEVEKTKQDDALDDLSNILGELKGMAMDMSYEIEKQTKALGRFDDDVEEIGFRVKGANQRARRLLGK